MRIAVSVLICVATATAHAQMWQDATPDCLGTTAEWSSKLELNDIDGDGQLDILVANGSGYSTKGANPEPSRVWKNLGNWSGAAPHCQEVSSTVLGGFTGFARVIRAADIDGDGKPEIFVGGAYQTQAKLFRNTGEDISAQLPQQLTSLGDAEFGDVDGDGDLDLVMVDWGAGDAENNAGGVTRLYLNDGTGHFTIAPSTATPAQLIEFSWDISLVDVDNDWDLDLLVASKGATSFLFLNDGHGGFTLAPDALPHHANNYSLEPMDVDGDGWLDLATINDGAGGRNTLLINHDGVFADETSTRLTGTANPPTDDNAVVFLDADDDGDADMLVASLSGPERLLLNDGSGHFTLAAGSATPNDTPGSLGIAVGDLNGDGRLDVVQSQGEVAFPEKVQLATTAIAIDTQPPSIALEHVMFGATRIHARIHDHQSPSRLADWKSVVLTADGHDIPMHWYGEYLWVADTASPVSHYQVCATDRQNNMACRSDDATVAADDFPPMFLDAGTHPGGAPSGGCCDSGGSTGALFAPLLILFVSARTRSRRRGSGSPPRDPR